MNEVLKIHEAAQDARPIYVYDLPDEAVELNDPYVKKSVGLRKLSMSEELESLEIAASNPARAAFFMMVKSLVEVDDRKIDKAGGEDERIVNNTDPIIRSLLVDAQATLSSASSKGTASFLKSRRVKV
jgi:hypothetical protein